MDWRTPLALAILMFAEGLMYDKGATTSAWDRALNGDHRFTLRVLARLTQGEVLRTNSGNPVRSRAVLAELQNWGLAEAPAVNEWRPTFLGRRVAKMLDLESDDAVSRA